MEREAVLAHWLETTHFQSLYFKTTTVKIIIRLRGRKECSGSCLDKKYHDPWTLFLKWLPVVTDFEQLSGSKEMAVGIQVSLAFLWGHILRLQVKWQT